MIAPITFDQAALDTDFIAESEVTRKLLAMAKRAAHHSAHLLITGEPGAGKELLARMIHLGSLRSGKPWMAIDCASMPQSLIESEIFGQEKGSASAAPGLCEMADGGTLFLDQIGKLDSKTQVKLLRVLDGDSYYRVGGNRKMSVNVRVIAAASQDLEESVRAGSFRSDLYDRIRQFTLSVPPLRERPEDILAIAECLLEKYLPGAIFAPETVAVLRRYAWPGNVGELRNAIIFASMIAERGRIFPHHLPSLGDESEVFASAGTPQAISEQPATAPPDAGRKVVFEALRHSKGQQDRAAQLLGISRRTLSRKLKEYRMRDMEGSGLPPGSMRQELQEQFRSEVQVKVRLTNGRGESVETHTVNVSLRGFAAARIADPFQYAEPAVVSFVLPESIVPIIGKADISWAGRNGQAGFRYVELTQESRRELRCWLLKKQGQQERA